MSSFFPAPDRDVRQGKRGRGKLRSGILFLSGAEKGDIPEQWDCGDFCLGLVSLLPTLSLLSGNEDGVVHVRDLKPQPHASRGLVSTP